MVYWGASFLCDFFFLIILISLMAACLPIFEKYSAFTNNGGAGKMFFFRMAKHFMYKHFIRYKVSQSFFGIKVWHS